MVIDYLNSLSKRVRVLRDDLGLSQGELSVATKGELSQSMISKIERGIATPGATGVAALARALKTSTDFLLLLTDNPAPPAFIDDEEPLLLREGGGVYGIESGVEPLFRLLSPLRQAEVLDMMRWMLTQDDPAYRVHEIMRMVRLADDAGLVEEIRGILDQEMRR